MAMPAIHRRWIPSAVRALAREDRAWPRYELIDGELLVTPAPRTAHQLIALELWALINAHLGRESFGLALMSPSELELRPGTIAQPDVFVIPATTVIAADTLQWSDVTSLLLAVEVLSPSSNRTDRVIKRDFYMEAGVAEYWIVDLEARVVERWRPAQETPELHRDRVEWAPLGGGALSVDLPALFARIDTKLRMFAGRT